MKALMFNIRLESFIPKANICLFTSTLYVLFVRHYFSACMLTCTALVTCLACIMPALNCMFLFLLVLPIVVLMVAELRK